MGKPYAFEFQNKKGDTISIVNDSTVDECRVFNLARANGLTLIGLYEGGSGIHRRVEWRPN